MADETRPSVPVRHPLPKLHELHQRLRQQKIGKSSGEPKVPAEHNGRMPDIASGPAVALFDSLHALNETARVHQQIEDARDLEEVRAQIDEADHTGPQQEATPPPIDPQEDGLKARTKALISKIQSTIHAHEDAEERRTQDAEVGEENPRLKQLEQAAEVLLAHSDAQVEAFFNVNNQTAEVTSEDAERTELTERLTDTVVGFTAKRISDEAMQSLLADKMRKPVRSFWTRVGVDVIGKTINTVAQATKLYRAGRWERKGILPRRTTDEERHEQLVLEDNMEVVRNQMLGLPEVNHLHDQLTECSKEELLPFFADVLGKPSELIMQKIFSSDPRFARLLPDFENSTRHEMITNLLDQGRNQLGVENAETMSLAEVISMLPPDSPIREALEISQINPFSYRESLESQKNVEQTYEEDPEWHEEFEEALDDHAVVASLINRRNYWRLFTELNFGIRQIIDAVKRKKRLLIGRERNHPGIARVLTYDAGAARPNLIPDAENYTENREHIDKAVIRAILKTNKYNMHEWSVGAELVGEELNNRHITTAATYHNRSLRFERRNGKFRPTETLVPNKQIAVVRETGENSRIVKLFDTGNIDRVDETYEEGFVHGYESAEEKMLECWINAEGDNKKFNEAWDTEVQAARDRYAFQISPDTEEITLTEGREAQLQALVAGDEQADIDPELRLIFQTIAQNETDTATITRLTRDAWTNMCSTYERANIDNLSQLLTIPIVFMPEGITETGAHSLQELQETTNEKVVRLRDTLPTSCMAGAFNVNQYGDFAIDFTHTHDKGDGVESNNYANQIIQRTMRELNAERTAVVLPYGSVDTSRIYPPLEVLDKEPGYTPVQAYADGTQFTRFCLAMKKRVDSLKAIGAIDAKSTLSNPAMIAELYLVDQYRAALKSAAEGSKIIDTSFIDNGEPVGALLRDKDIRKDLELFPFTEGFDLTSFQQMDTEKQDEYLVALSKKIVDARDNSSMNVIRDASQNFQNPAALRLVNLNAEVFYKGYKVRSNPWMISFMPLPTEKAIAQGSMQSQTSGPAGNYTHDNVVTFIPWGITEPSIEQPAQGNRVIFSIEVKNRDNIVGYKFAQNMQKILEDFDYDETRVIPVDTLYEQAIAA